MDLSSSLIKVCTIVLVIAAIFWPEHRTLSLVGLFAMFVGYGIGRLAPPLGHTDSIAKPAHE